LEGFALASGLGQPVAVRLMPGQQVNEKSYLRKEESISERRSALLTWAATK
jgi:hypothetical protein